MNAQEFFQLAEISVSNNPKDRLPKDIRNLIAALPPSADKMMFDVHSHCFTVDHVPAGALNPGWARRLPPGPDIIAFLFRAIGQFKKWVAGKDYEYYETFGRKRYFERFTEGKSSDDILMGEFNRYNQAFEKKMTSQRPHIFIVELMMDMERGIRGDVKKPFYEQWKELSELRSLRQHNKSLIPFLAVDPHNPNVYADFLAAFSDLSKRVNRTGQDFLDHAFPFFGVKIYPSLGYLPSDPVLMNIFKVCAEKKIPVTTHCGGALVRFSATRIKGKFHTSNGKTQTVEDFDFDYSKFGNARQATEIARFFNAPNNWIPVADAFPALKINLAHFGGKEEWKHYRNGAPRTHIHETLELLARYPNVYADISYACATLHNMAELLEMLYNSDKFTSAQRDVFRTKLLYGSGYYMAGLEKKLDRLVLNLLTRFENDKAMFNQIWVHNPMRFLLE